MLTAPDDSPDEPSGTTALTDSQSRRNVFVASATGFMGFAGFTVVMPFLPLYIRELGIEDVGDIALWSGLTLGATPAITAISAPLWGRVGDRYGSKLLVIRSLSAFALTKAAMAFVTAPWQLVALRALLGVFAGYGALTMSMAAESVPSAVPAGRPSGSRSLKGKCCSLSRTPRRSSIAAVVTISSNGLRSAPGIASSSIAMLSPGDVPSRRMLVMVGPI